jgi:thiaminase/transcriptional activator TenA
VSTGTGTGLTERLFAVGEPFVQAQLGHPTVRALEKGELGEAVARSWLEQDFLFLREEVRVLTRLAWQAPSHHREELLRLACNVVDLEIPNHRELGGLFGADLDGAAMGPVTGSYTHWLLEAAADYGVGLTALLSGLWGYSTLGQRMTLPSEPRFRRWVESYKAPEFAPLALRFARMVEDAGPDPDRALGTFLTGMVHEIAFWTAP